MPFSADFVPLYPASIRRPFRYLIALAMVAAATLLRLAADPILQDQLPYFVYVGASVVATWVAGVEGGLLAVVVATFAGNYFFVPPRFTLDFRPADLAAMLTFAAFSLGLVWLVGRWRKAETRVRTLHRRTAEVLNQMPVAVVLAEPSGRVLFQNLASTRLFGSPLPPAVDMRGYRQHFRYQVYQADGTPLDANDAPMARALAGETVSGYEARIVHADGTRRTLAVSAAPIRDEAGRVVSAVATFSDVTEERLAGEALRERTEELQTVLDAVPAAVYVTRDSRASLIEGNQFAAEYMRVPFGANLSLTAPPGQAPTTVRAVKDDKEVPGTELPVQLAIARGVEIRDYEMDLMYGDGGRRTLFGNATPLRDEDGRVRGAVGAFMDVTELKRVLERLQESEALLQQRMEDLERHSRELEESEARLEGANRVKDEFLATLSHELRTPLNAILGWSDLLIRPGLQGEAQRKALESINRNAKSQAALIDDILDVSRIITGNLRLDVRPVDVREVVKASCESIQPAAAARGVEIRAVVHPHAVVVGDPDRLQQVLWNLLSNSVKFSDAGSRIDVDVRQTNAHVRIVVRDMGTGIAPDLLPHVFERFRQGDSSTTRARGGLGLGLAIVRHLVELHGGTVTAESEGAGLGATFTVDLPVRSLADTGADRPRVSAGVTSDTVGEAAAYLAGLHVVAVDDQEETRALIRAVLEARGAQVTVCSTADDTLATVARERPDVLVADIGMPQVDGYELIRRIRASQDHHAATLPSIALTAYGSEHDRARALAAGYWEHLAKPIMPSALAMAVAAVAGRKVGGE